jgi:hypothetical protein
MRAVARIPGVSKEHFGGANWGGFAGKGGLTAFRISKNPSREERFFGWKRVIRRVRVHGIGRN